MAKNLVIVESPTKSSTIEKMLGKNYEILASYGHIIDLPNSTLGIKITDNEYTPRYKVLTDKKQVLEKLKDKAKKATKIYLASDPDREGEAIAWHISKELKKLKELKNKDNIKRITFNEITKTAVQNAVKNPRDIDMNLVDAQQARRMSDRIVGYTISPLLWSRINMNASAGRVQSVSLKLICDLQDEINNFIPEKYYDVSLELEKGITVKLDKIDEEKIEKLQDEKEYKNILEILKDKKIETTKVEIKDKTQNPPPALKTSVMQQLASTYLNFSPSKTMKIAQELFEGIKIEDERKGLITYMRTDSTRISEEAKNQAKEYITKVYGKENAGNLRKDNDKNSQGAHEAIRPTYVELTPDSIKNHLSKDQYSLYKLIWERFLISQFAPVKYKQMRVETKKDKYTFVGIVNKIIKEGYYKIYNYNDKIEILEFPDIKENEILSIKDILTKEDMTKPPAQFTESSLIRKLESLNIGRPSTYASILQTLHTKKYIEIVSKKLVPTELGFEVKKELEENFKAIMNVKFTEKLEKELDNIAEGKTTMFKVVDSLYKVIKKESEDYNEKLQEFKKRKIYTDVMCKDNVHKMLYKTGRYGKYLVCEIDEKETISIKNIVIDPKEVEEGFVKVKDKLTLKEEKKDIFTDIKTVENKVFLLKHGRFGYYLESEDYKNDGQRITLDKKLQNKIDAKKVEIDDKGILKLNQYIEKEREKRKKILESAGNCEKCGSSFILKKGKFGEFLACSNYPKCKNIKNIKK